VHTLQESPVFKAVILTELRPNPKPKSAALYQPLYVPIPVNLPTGDVEYYVRICFQDIATSQRKIMTVSATPSGAIFIRESVPSPTHIGLHTWVQAVWVHCECVPLPTAAHRSLRL